MPKEQMLLELKRAEGLEVICRKRGETSGATAHQSTARAIRAELAALDSNAVG